MKKRKPRALRLNIFKYKVLNVRFPELTEHVLIIFDKAGKAKMRKRERSELLKFSIKSRAYRQRIVSANTTFFWKLKKRCVFF